MNIECDPNQQNKVHLNGMILYVSKMDLKIGFWGTFGFQELNSWFSDHLGAVRSKYFLVFLKQIWRLFKFLFEISRVYSWWLAADREKSIFSTQHPPSYALVHPFRISTKGERKHFPWKVKVDLSVCSTSSHLVNIIHKIACINVYVHPFWHFELAINCFYGNGQWTKVTSSVIRIDVQPGNALNDKMWLKKLQFTWTTIVCEWEKQWKIVYEAYKFRYQNYTRDHKNGATTQIKHYIVAVECW